MEKLGKISENYFCTEQLLEIKSLKNIFKKFSFEKYWKKMLKNIFEPKSNLKKNSIGKCLQKPLKIIL